MTAKSRKWKILQDEWSGLLIIKKKGMGQLLKETDWTDVNCTLLYVDPG